MSFQTGENVGPYRIVAKLGQGGVATVFKAYHPALDRFVAIKVLHPAFKEDPNFLARFQREARVVARLEHANIVPVYDYAEHEGQSYLVMKYIEGRTLKAALSEGRLAPQEGLRIVEAVGEGLIYAHSRGVLHRDIKPSNILLDGQKGIYLADFGLARIAQAGESTLSSDMLLGTPQYISPEQARGEKELDAGTDVYSLGVVIYEMVVGRVPFNADTPFSIIHDHIYTPLPMPREVNQRVPEAVERVLLKALAKERADRFQSVRDLVEAFQSSVLEGKGDRTDQVLSDEKRAGTPDLVPGQVEQGTAVDRQDSRSRTRRWLWGAAGAALACFCLFTFLALANRGDRERGAAGQPTTTAELSQTTDQGLPAEGLAVLSARATMEADPADPAGHLHLAQELYKAGFPAQASQSLVEGAQLLMGRGDYVRAANALLSGLEVSGGPVRGEGRVSELTVEALYLSAGEGQAAAAVVERAGEAFPDWEVLVPIRARLALHISNPQVNEIKPGLLEELRGRGSDPLAQAVLAEDLHMRGENELALEKAREVFRNPDSPEWLVRHVDTMMGEIIAE